MRRGRSYVAIGRIRLFRGGVMEGARRSSQGRSYRGGHRLSLPNAYSFVSNGSVYYRC